MINEQDFKAMRKEFEEFEASRESGIQKSREVIKLSKQAIYSVHREELDRAGQCLKEMQPLIKKMTELAQPEAGYYRVAIQEYVEAACIYEYEKNGNLMERKKLDVGAELYLLGICDLSGELTRLAVNAVIKGDFAKAMKIKDMVSDIYGQIIQFDFRNGELRAKFDRIKYDVKKLEDLALELRMRGFTGEKDTKGK